MIKPLVVKCSAKVLWSIPLTASLSKFMPELIRRLIELWFHNSFLSFKYVKILKLLEIEFEIELPCAYRFWIFTIRVTQCYTQLNQFKFINIFSHHKVLKQNVLR